MDEAYKHSILMIRSLNDRRISAKEYNKIAMQFNLLSTITLRYITNMSFCKFVNYVLQTTYSFMK